MPTISDLLGEFSRARRGSGKKGSGVQRYVDCLLLFERWLVDQGVCEVAQIDEILVADYRDSCIEDRGNKPSTVEKRLTAIRALARWAVKKGYMASDPTVEVEWPRRMRPAPKPLTPVELELLRQILANEPEGGSELWHHRRNRLVIYLMYYAGLRLGETARLLVKDVNLVAATVTIRESKGRDRSVVLHPDLVVELASWIAGRHQANPVIPSSKTGKPMKPTVLAKVFENWLVARGLRISAHRLRHSFGTELLRACGNLGLVQDAMGHASPETTRMYTLIVVEDQRPAIARLPGLGVPQPAPD